MTRPPQTPFNPPAAWMTIGCPVSLLPIDLESGLLSGEITHWLGGDAGLIATIGVRTTAEVAAICAGERLWLSGREAVRRELVVLEVVARPASGHPASTADTTIALTGVLPLAQEHRRNAVRAATRSPVRLTFADGATADGVSDDISRTGCLVALNSADLLQTIGSAAHVEIELPGNKTVSLPADVVRIASATGDVALRFQPADIDLSQIDRLVYTTVRRYRAVSD